MPRSLMIFAAGFGTRMGALTADRPKPLVDVAGRPLIDHALALAEAAGVQRVVVNLHYRGDMLAAHLARHPFGRRAALSWERAQILETGGGLRAALPLLGDGPVMVLNSDAVFTGANPLAALRAAWEPARMDTLLIVAPAADLGRDRADFAMAADGRLSRAGGAAGVTYLGAGIVAPAGLAAFPEPVFSLNRLWDAHIAAGRAFGLPHDGGWCDVGRPEGIAAAETMLEAAGVR